MAFLLAQVQPAPVRLQDEGVSKGYIDTLNCTGTAVTCSVAGRKGTINVVAGGGAGTPGGVSGNLQTNDGLGGFGAYAGASCAYAVKTLDASGASTCTAAPTIPTDISGEQYWTAAASANLSAEKSLGGFTALVLNTAGTPSGYAGTSCSANQYMNALDGSGVKTCAQVAYAQVSGTPTIPADISGKTYIVQTADATLTAEQALGALATGIVKNTTTTGVLSIAASGTDYAPATSGSVLLLGNGAGGFSNYAGASSCTNQFFTGLSTVGASTCTTATLASAQFANQGTTTTLLHGNAAGNPSFAAVADADITPAYSGTGACAAGTFASTLNRNAAPTCTSDNWHFLGTATGATTTVGPIVWTAVVRQIQCWYQIAGYNGGTPVGRFQIGTASISTTARTNSYAISEGVTAPTTASGATATPGIPLAVTLSAVGRAGQLTVEGASGAVKVINVLGNNQTPAVATVPTIFQGSSFFSDLGTNLAITRAQLTVYDTLTATAASAQTFTAGTYLACWGRNTN